MRIRLSPRALALVCALGSLLPLATHASLACPSPPCDSAATCEKVADWIVEGVFTLNMNTIWLEDAVLVRGDYPVLSKLTYLQDASPTCWPSLPPPPLETTAKHLSGQRIRAYGTNMAVAFVSRGAMFVEVLPRKP